MERIELLEIFPQEYRDLVQRYIQMLKRIFNEYDVVIFMARKAICFYKSLVVGRYIEKPKRCKVFSSRILTYNVEQKLKNERIVVVDDVMLKGKSLTGIITSLLKKKIHADAYIMAKPNDNESGMLGDTNIIGTYAVLSMDDILLISKYITAFIEASICPYNIDQPIYRIMQLDEEAFDSFALKHNFVNITSEFQQEYGIKNYVLEIPKHFITDNELAKIVSICKIRFLYGRYCGVLVLLAIPFVLFNEMKYSELENMFSYINSDYIHHFIHNKSEYVVFENQLKVLQFVLSTQLMDAFQAVYDLGEFSRLDSNDYFTFSEDILQKVSKTDNIFMFSDMPNQTELFGYDFIHNEYLNLTYSYLHTDESLRTHYYCDSENFNDTKSEPLLVLSKLIEYITDHIGTSFNHLTFTCIIDTLIDKGLLIPSIVHNKYNKSIIRAYKCGEIYALDIRHFELFSYVLNEYLAKIGNNRLKKLEFEKLCVLFFRESVHKRIVQISKSGEGYDICYSLYGPRVSSSMTPYATEEKLTLAKKLLKHNLIKVKKKEIEIGIQQTDSSNTSKTIRYSDLEYYEVTPKDNADLIEENWLDIANTFTDKLEIIYRRFFIEEEDGNIIFDDVRNMYMRNYTEFLILLSIGKNKKNQLLSLLAEIHLFNSVKIEGTVWDILIKYNEVFGGFVNGMWKYMCYNATIGRGNKKRQIHPLDIMIEEMEKDKENKPFVIPIKEFLQTNRDTDKNDNIAPTINRAGRLIYSIVYTLWFMSKRYMVYYRVNNELVNLEQRKKLEFFYSEMEEIRKASEIQVSSSTIQQNIDTLRSFKEDADEIIKFYNSEIAHGKPHIGENARNTTEEGDSKMGMTFNINGDIHGSVNNLQNGTMNITNSNNYIDKICDELKSLEQYGNDNEKVLIKNAIDAANEKNERKLLIALKAMGSFIGRVASTVSANVLIAYMQSNGIIP